MVRWDSDNFPRSSGLVIGHAQNLGEGIDHGSPFPHIHATHMINSQHKSKWYDQCGGHHEEGETRMNGTSEGVCTVVYDGGQ